MIMPIRSKLYTGKTVAEELSEDFRNEIMGMLKQVAHDHKCNVEDLKFTVNNLGIVNIRRMTDEDKAKEAISQEIKHKIKIYRKMKGFNNG